MASILDHITSVEERHYQPGDIILEEGGDTGQLLFLIKGSVEVLKDGVQVATASQSGAVFGELAALLGGSHKATVRALEPCAFGVVENPRAFLETSPLVCLHICELLAHRLDAMNRYLVDVKQQYAGESGLGMVDGVLETLMNRHPSPRVRAGQSSLAESESLD